MDVLKSILNEEEKKRFEEKTLSRIKEDERLKEILVKFDADEDLIFRSLPALARYLDDKVECENCSSLECCKKNHKGYRIGLKYNPYVDLIEVKEMACLERVKLEKVLEKIVISDVDLNKAYEVYKKALSALSVKSSVDNSFSKVFNSVGSSIKKYSLDLVNKGSYVYSDNNNSFSLMMLVAFLFASRNTRVAILDSRKTLQDLMSFDKSVKAQAEARLESAKKEQVLILVNLGFEYRSSKMRDLYISPLLSDRCKKGMITFASSKVSKDDLIKAYASDELAKKVLKSSFEKLFKEEFINDFEIFDNI